MNIRQLRFFEDAVRYGSFSAAARVNHVTVQAVSKSIHELEGELGGKLFSRGGRRVSLTPLGRALLGPVQSATASFDAVEESAAAWRRAAGVQSGLRIALVSPPFVKHELICGAISRLLARALDTETKLSVSLGDAALADLRMGAVDALVTIGPLDAPHCRCVPVGTVTPGVHLNRRHPLARKKVLSFEGLEPYPVLRSETIDGFNDGILALCQRAGLASTPVTIDSNEEVVDFLERQNGFILNVYLKALSFPPLAIIHELDPEDAVPIPLCLVTPEGTQRPEVERLRRLFRSEHGLLRSLLGFETE